MIHLVMCVGFSVDFSVHVCHAFLAVRSDKPTEVLQKAFDKAGGPIFNAAFSSLLGISMLSLSQSYIFQSFGKVMFLVIGFGLLHAALFLPLVLSIIFSLTDKKNPEFHQNNNTSDIPSKFTNGKRQNLPENIIPISTSKIHPIVENISKTLKADHISNCFENEILKISIQSVRCTYPVDKGMAYTYKDVFIYSSNQRRYWDFVDPI
jgi:hypothetical protein